jgi:hypothetical protein
MRGSRVWLSAAAWNDEPRPELCRTCLFLQGQPVREPQLGVKPPSSIVQVDHVLVCRPNRRQAHVAWAAQTKLKRAWLIAAG